MTRRTNRTRGAVWLGVLGVLLAAASAEAQGGPFSFFSLPPCRIVDTRDPNGPTGGPKLAANTGRSFPVGGFCGVPTTAQAVVFNVTVAEPTDLGDLRIFPFGTTGPPLASAPLASVINWISTDVAIANGAIIPLGLGGVEVLVDMVPGSTGQVHLILDVTGYFE